ncbi:hypothetical protein FOL47_006572 [Perkinsus chesapeaki]|uniref:Uncharacterized protein n=1 Tax=Perkinsus chesapeaki TaxID=330153 RepID=A0A7J6MZA7_PERCH|nr:hypothetical protein FOL47_006572 [Perkinsus chesapeaki]
MGCNKHFKDSLLARGGVDNAAVTEVPIIVGYYLRPCEDDKDRAQGEMCLVRGEPKTDAQMEVYNRDFEGLYYACEATIGRYGDDIAELVADEYHQQRVALVGILTALVHQLQMVTIEQPSAIEHHRKENPTVLLKPSSTRTLLLPLPPASPDSLLSRTCSQSLSSSIADSHQPTCPPTGTTSSLSTGVPPVVQLARGVKRKPVDKVKLEILKKDMIQGTMLWSMNKIELFSVITGCSGSYM